jgi:ribosomal protein S27E
MIGERAHWNCSDCDSSDLFRENGSTFKCDNCGRTVHESVGESAETLARLAERDDDAGAIARVLLETGGVKE